MSGTCCPPMGTAKNTKLESAAEIGAMIDSIDSAMVFIVMPQILCCRIHDRQSSDGCLVSDSGSRHAGNHLKAPYMRIQGETSDADTGSVSHRMQKLNQRKKRSRFIDALHG